MANEVQLRVNDTMRTVTAAPDTPLLYVLTDDLALQGPRFGCGWASVAAARCSSMAWRSGRASRRSRESSASR